MSLYKKYKFNYIELTEVELETSIGVNNAQKQFKDKIKKFVNKDNFYLYFQKGNSTCQNLVLLFQFIGTYISFIDSDDTIEPNFYTELLPYAEKYG